MGKLYENKTGAFGLGNLMGNIYKVINGEISEEKHWLKHKFFSETSNWLLHTKSILQLHRQWRE